MQSPAGVSRSFALFYIMVAYVFIAYLWWGWLLLNTVDQHYQIEIELLYQRLKSENGEGYSREEFHQAEAYHQLMDEFRRKRLMILSEGAVFLLLLFIGSWRVRQTLLRERGVIRQQSNFLLAVTHELKSPLASLKLALQTLRYRKPPPEKAERLIHYALDDVERLGQLIDNILLVTRLDAHYEMVNQRINLSEVVSRMLENYRQNPASRWLQADIEPEIYIMGDTVALESIVRNLIENAFKYAPETPVRVAVRKQDNRAILEVADQGKGIPDEEKEKIFEKFYRIGDENTRTTPGTGLGLFIVKQLVKLHKAKIEVRDNTPSGTRFIICFPLAGNHHS